MNNVHRGNINVLEASNDILRENLRKGNITVSIYGLGHIGIALASAWLLAGAKVIGVDMDKNKVRKLNEGLSPIQWEPNVPQIIHDAWSQGRVEATVNGVDASRRSNVKIVAVPITIDFKRKKPNLESLITVSKAIGKGLSKGDLVVIESTVPPGTTEEVVLKELERCSNMRVEEDFGLAYSPERVAEGRALKDIIESYPKIVAGIGPKSTRAISSLYKLICKKGVYEVSSIKVAELEKVFEGVYRDVNIALANELARLARTLGVDYNEIREAANSQPHCHLHMPGTGVGGICIPLYPYFLKNIADKLNVKLELIMKARTINKNMPKEVIDLTLNFIRKLRIEDTNIKIAILGLAFRGDIPDSRLSPTYSLVKQLIKLGYQNVIVHDHLIKDDEILKRLGVILTMRLEEAIKDANVIIVSTDHSLYRKINLNYLLALAKKPTLIVDGRNVIEIGKDITLPKGVIYVGIGRGAIMGRP